MEIACEPLRAEDHPDLFRLMESEEYLSETLERMGMSLEQFRATMLKTGSIHTIVVDGEVAGFHWAELRERTLHLHGLVLEEAMQGRGIGTLIFAWLAETYKGAADQIELGVHSGNERAIQLYQRLGFRTVRVMGELGFLIMEKPLDR